jgi:3-hydroxyacyl-[acyl-carrier-protein] dehydratase
LSTFPNPRDLIPHRPPFLFVDSIEELEAERILTKRTFLADEVFYQGHYPGNPITPGVLLCEACYQTGALLIAGNAVGELKGVPVLTRSNNAKFRGMVKPGDTITVEVTLDQKVSNAYFMKATVRNSGKVALRLDFAVSLVETE